MTDTQTEKGTESLLAIPRVVERSRGDLVHQAFDRLLSFETRVTTAAEVKRLLADQGDTE